MSHTDFSSPLLISEVRVERLGNNQGIITNLLIRKSGFYILIKNVSKLL